MRYIISLLALLLSYTVVAQEPQQDGVAPQVEVVEQPLEADNVALWERGNQAYIDGDFASALSNYSAIENSGNYSARLYYNMGNAYFKQNMLGKAILYYNRALVQIFLKDTRKGCLDLSKAGELGIEGAYDLLGNVQQIRQ